MRYKGLDPIERQSIVRLTRPVSVDFPSVLRDQPPEGVEIIVQPNEIGIDDLFTVRVGESGLGKMAFDYMYSNGRSVRYLLV